MHEIAVQPLGSERNTGKKRMRPPRMKRVPSHVRDFQIGIGWLDAIDLARDPAQALRDLVFPPAFGHELHANADAKERPAAHAHALLERFYHSADRIEPAPAVGEGTH